MKTLVEYLVNNHIKSKLSLFIKNVDVYKEMPYDKFIRYSDSLSIVMADKVTDIVKNLYGVSSLTKEQVIDFLTTHYQVFLDMQFTDKRITDKIYERLLDGDTRFSSAEKLIKYFKDGLYIDEKNTPDRFTHWSCPCLFNAFIKIVDEINNGNT